MLIGKKGGTCKLTITKKGNNLYNDISKEIMIKIYNLEFKIIEDRTSVKNNKNKQNEMVYDI